MTAIILILTFAPSSCLFHCPLFIYDARCLFSQQIKRSLDKVRDRVDSLLMNFDPLMAKAEIIERLTRTNFGS